MVTKDQFNMDKCKVVPVLN